MNNEIDHYLRSDSIFFFNWKTWIVIIILLSFIGINVFLYLAQGTDFVKNTLQSLLQPKNTTISHATLLPSFPPPLPPTNYDSTTYDQLGHDIKDQYPDIMVNNALNRTINTKRAEDNILVEPSTHDNGKWCYVGKFDGQRICNHMANDDQCASGNIFPSMDICINPNLRS